MKGKIELYQQIFDENENSHPIKTLKDGECFGEMSFFTGLPRACCSKSTDFTTLFLIKREDFLKVLSRNPEDYVKN